ncbi:TonB-dependent receptor [Membranihabitans marinus]|uniref:TonB-dependent receptor n=1 Tax=Membranihabitans marinus TaxID=1227546 RepID=UPI001F476754|nr:TonB-dependent receptor [Membranihabitans marinus]
MKKFLTKQYLIMMALLIIGFSSYGQQKYTISGTISDAVNGEELIGAAVFIEELGSGASSNEYGFYSLTVPQGSYTLKVSYLGYETITKLIELDSSLTLDFELGLGATKLDVVVVSSEQKEKNVTSTQMSVNTLNMSEIAMVPVLFGENDVIKTIQLLPGIKSSEGGGGFFVRGGSSDQNLILLDDAPVYNASHLLGFFSVFNSDAIKDLTIYKGHIPAEYGGRASSVLDIKMNDGNSKKLNVGGGIGLISSRLTVEAPIVKDKGSFILSGRRTYVDVFLKLSQKEEVKNSILYFYDLNAKGNYRLGKKDRVFVSGYFGRDMFGYSDLFGFDWGNKTATVRWNHLFNDKLFLNTTALFSDYDYDVEIAGDEDQDNGFVITSSIQDLSLKEDFEYYISPRNTLKFGLSAIYHTFIPGQIKAGQNSYVNDVELQKKYAWETAIYVSEDLSITDNLKINTGLRYSWFAQIGPGEIYTYDEDGDVIDEKNYKSGEIVKTYGGLEPRLGITYTLDEESSVKASYGRNRQYLHLLSNSSTGTPIDLWIPSSNNVKPQIADQYALGYFRNFKSNAYESSLEIYYKDMLNQVDYKTGADIIFNENVESELLFGSGRSYGAELYVKKKVGQLNGWVSYTWSKTERKFDGIDYGEYYPASWDRTHDISIVGIYQLNPRWTFSSTFVFRTGEAVTYPVGKYDIEGEVINLYSKRNADRYPNYHRLDIGATRQLKSNDKFESSLNFSIYNVYGRRNAYIINFGEDPNDSTKTRAERIALFSILPSITYNFKFK